VLLFAIMFLIPQQTPVGLSLPLLLRGALGLANLVLQWHRARKHRDRLSVARRSTLPIVALISVIVIAVSVLAGQTTAFYWLVPVMLLFLASATRNAWDLFIGMRGTGYGSNDAKGK
jgi:hypothetical protein